MTPAVRVLEAAKVAFTLHEYEHNPTADSFGLEAASKLGVSPERVFKTLIAQVDGRDLVAAIVPVDATILVSAGRRGLQIELAASDLVRLTAATSAAISVR